MVVWDLSGRNFPDHMVAALSSIPAPNASEMCRNYFSTPGKRHFLCLTCRRGITQVAIRDYLANYQLAFIYAELKLAWAYRKNLGRREKQLGRTLDELEGMYRDATHRCPDCQQPMLETGKAFLPPAHADASAWENLAVEYPVGHAFHLCGCEGPGLIPRNPDLQSYYWNSRAAEFRRQLNRANSAIHLCEQRKAEAMGFWRSQLAKVELLQTRLPIPAYLP